MHYRSLSSNPRSAASSPTKSQTLPRTCRASLPSGTRIARSKMFALSMGLLDKLGLKKKPAVAAVGNHLSAPPPSSAAADQALQAYISASPLLASCGISATDLIADLSQWKAKGEEIAKNLNFPLEFASLEEFQRRRIYQYYLPVYFWCQKQLAAHRASGAKTPLVIGISAPQGCGKSTLCEQLEALFTSSGSTAASVSVDDFYLSYDGQQAVAQTYATNPLLQMRGNAGSHDLDLGAETLQALRAATSAKDAVKLPRYDKSAYQGKGDRAAPTAWPSVSGPVDIVLFEGWMLGFAPVEESQASSVDPNLIPVNAFLQAYKSAWDSAVDSWLVVKVKDPKYAHKWRLQAERAMRAAGKPAMSDEQVEQFVDRFMPAYKCYLPGLYKNGPTTAATGKVLVVEVDENREPISKQPQPIM